MRKLTKAEVGDASPRTQESHLLPELLAVRDLARWNGRDAASDQMHEIWRRVSRIVEGLQVAELGESEALPSQLDLRDRATDYWQRYSSGKTGGEDLIDALMGFAKEHEHHVKSEAPRQPLSSTIQIPK